MTILYYALRERAMILRSIGCVVCIFALLGEDASAAKGLRVLLLPLSSRLDSRSAADRQQLLHVRLCKSLMGYRKSKNL